MHAIWPIVLAACLAGAVVLYIYGEQIREKKLVLRVQKLCASQLFEDMTPMVHFARHHTIEKLIVDKTGVIFRFLPNGQETAFLMRPNGYHYLTPEQQEAMRTLLENCLPNLRDTDKYRYGRRRITLLNGDVEYNYHYTITNAYKAKLSRAAYYDEKLRQQSW